MSTVRLEISPNPAHVRTARLVAVAMARECGVDEGCLDEIRLAVGEACSRAVSLHRLHGRDDLVAVEFSDGPRFAVAVRDIVPVESAPPRAESMADPLALFDPDSAGAPATSPVVDSPPADSAGPVGEADAVADTPGSPEETLAAGVGLALLAGLVDDLSVAAAESGPGTVVRMSWPAG